jgi:hypothetical protein
MAAFGFQRTQSGDLISPVVSVAPEVKWTPLGPITVQQAYPAVAARDYTTVNAIADANIIEWTVPNDATHFMLNFETTANSDSQVVSILVSASDKKSDGTTTDDFLFGGSLTLTGGQQVARHTNVYCDTATATDGVLTLVVWDTGNDRVCVVTGNAKSFKRFRIVATTLAAKTELYANCRWYSVR